MAKTIRNRSILNDLTDRETARTEPISTISRPTVALNSPPVQRRNSPSAVISGTFVESLDDMEQHADIKITYDPTQGFVGADIFRATSMSGSFELKSTAPLTKLSGSVSYKDYEIGESDTFYYYSIFFDKQARLSDRTNIISITKSFDVISEHNLLTLASKKIDPGSGIILLSYKYNKPHGQKLVAKRMQVFDENGIMVGENVDMTEPVEINDWSINFLTLKAKVFDANGMVITQNKSEFIDLDPIVWDFGAQSFGDIKFTPELDNNRILIDVNYENLYSDIKYVILLRRNLTSDEKQFGMPDPSWNTGTFLIPEDRVGTIQFIDFNVFPYDTYEYKAVGYDDAGGIAAILYKKVKLINLPKTGGEQ